MRSVPPKQRAGSRRWEVIVIRRGDGEWILGELGQTSPGVEGAGGTWVKARAYQTFWLMSGLLEGLEFGGWQILPSGLGPNVETSSSLGVTAVLLRGYCGSLGMGLSRVKQEAFYLPWDVWGISRSCVN